MLARDCEKSLGPLFCKLESLYRQFAAVRIFIVENNSQDNTKRIIEEYSRRNPDVRACCFNDGALCKLDRIDRMVILRNKCLSMVKEECKFKPDYLLILDADVNCKLSNLALIIEQAPPDWVMLAANGNFYFNLMGIKIPLFYYDLYAYVPEESRSCMLTKGQLFDSRFSLHKKLRGNRYVKCRSAFGGMAIYDYSAVEGHSYTLVPHEYTFDFKYMCEHVPFTLSLAGEGCCYICRKMKTLYEPVSMVTVLPVIKRHFLNWYLRREANRILRQRRRKNK